VRLCWHRVPLTSAGVRLTSARVRLGSTGVRLYRTAFGLCRTAFSLYRTAFSLCRTVVGLCCLSPARESGAVLEKAGDAFRPRSQQELQVAIGRIRRRHAAQADSSAIADLEMAAHIASDGWSMGILIREATAPSSHVRSAVSVVGNAVTVAGNAVTVVGNAVAVVRNAVTISVRTAHPTHLHFGDSIPQSRGGACPLPGGWRVRGATTEPFRRPGTHRPGHPGLKPCALAPPGRLPPPSPSTRTDLLFREAAPSPARGGGRWHARGRVGEGADGGKDLPSPPAPPPAPTREGASPSPTLG